ncbi:hypothetical protein A9Q83_06195 [Alphaproteobacteria bacterium 46_93_T64]|nr:hypothetical protein A9Q83_06195 [Alphaproteobacteria bacterium 46_93_T64]
MQNSAFKTLRSQSFWDEVPNNVKGACWMLAGSVLFSFMSVGVKYVGQGMDSFEIGFLRAFLGLIVIVPFVLYRGIGSLRTSIFKMHLFRSCVGITAMLATFYSITHMPLADATALTFTRPLFLIVLAFLFLGEIIRWRRGLATLVGFAGVLIMVQAQAEMGFATAVGLFAAFMVACVSVIIKKLTVTEHPTTIMFYFGLIGSVIAFVPASQVWITPTWEQLAVLIAVSIVGTGGNFCMIRAFGIGEATAVSPFDYTRLIFSGILAYFIFSEVPTLGMIAGAFIIVGSSIYIMQREARVKARTKASESVSRDA